MGPAIAAEPAGVVGCDARQQVRSGRGGNSINLEFQNRRSESVKIFWINAEGQEQEYGDVPSGFKYKQATSSDHVWMITDGEGGCIDIIRLEDLSTRASVIVIIDQTGVKI